MGRKEYIKESINGIIKEIMKMRLHMWELKANYGRQNLDNRCLMCQPEEDTTEHALECNKGDKKFNLNDERGKEWREIVEMYRKKKRQINR